MGDIEIVQHLSNGKTVKQIAYVAKEKMKAIEHRIFLMKPKYHALSQSHLVAIFFRKQLIK